MSMIKVTSEELRSTSADLQRGGEDVAQQLQSLEGKVRSLVDAEWSGAASDAFRDLWTQWHQGASQVKEALDGISQMLIPCRPGLPGHRGRARQQAAGLGRRVRRGISGQFGELRRRRVRFSQGFLCQPFQSSLSPAMRASRAAAPLPRLPLP